jgi:hypothetical protein
MTPNDEAPVTFTLTRDEAIVFFDFLSRFSRSEQLSIEHQAEERVLWDLECMLESTLHEPFSANYAQRVAEARENVRDKVSEG